MSKPDAAFRSEKWPNRHSGRECNSETYRNTFFSRKKSVFLTFFCIFTRNSAVFPISSIRALLKSFNSTPILSVDSFIGERQQIADA